MNGKEKTLMLATKKLLRKVGKAIIDYDLIRDGDRIAVALSGGKDSYTLLHILLELQKKAPVKFELVAVNLDTGFDDYESSRVMDYARSLGVESSGIESNIQAILDEKIGEGENHCFMCARLRRGILYSHSRKMGCNKLALGHHADDLIETLMLNMFFTSQLKSMPPKIMSDSGEVVVIRPLCHVFEDETRRFSELCGFPIVSCGCPHLSALSRGERAKVKLMLERLEQEYPEVKNRMLASLGRVLPRHLLDKSLHPFDE